MSQIGHIKLNIEKLKRDVSCGRVSFPIGACQYYHYVVISLSLYVIRGRVQVHYLVQILNLFSTIFLLSIIFSHSFLLIFFFFLCVAYPFELVISTPFILEIEWVFYPF